MRQHAKEGDRIKILDDNEGPWVVVGEVYYVLEVSDPNGDDDQRLYYFDGVEQSWFGEPQHFEILNQRSARMHQNYKKFSKGDVVVRWRDVESWEWDHIGEVSLPPIGEHLDIDQVDMGHDKKEPSIHISKHGGYWYPMKAFVLAEYYHMDSTTTTINRGTAELNTTDYGKSKITGISIEVQRSPASIVTGQRTSRSGIQSRRNATIVRGRYSCHKAITSK